MLEWCKFARNYSPLTLKNRKSLGGGRSEEGMPPQLGSIPSSRRGVIVSLPPPLLETSPYLMLPIRYHFNNIEGSYLRPVENKRLVLFISDDATSN